MLLRPVLMPILRNPLQGIADGVRNMLAELLGSSQFFAPLTHSLVLARGTGSPTFTRASTKTVENNDGYLVTLLAGEIGFPGARRVRNLITNPTENFNSGWTKIGGLTASGKTISFSASTDQLNGGVALPSPTGQYLLSFIISASAACETYLEIVDGVDGNPSFGSNVSITTVPTRVTIPCNLSVGTMSPVAPLFWVNRGSNASVAGKTITIDELQFEDITGRTDQTTPSEYVSVGVESSPAYHGSMVDGVKCFPTDLAGNALTTMRGYSAEGARTNLCLQSNAFTTTWANSGTPAATQNVVGPDGATSAWTLTDNNAASTEGVNQTIALTAATYTYSVFVKKTTGAQSSYPVVTADNGVSRIAACTIDTTNGVATAWTAYTGLTVQTSSASCISHNANYWRVSLTFLATAENWVHYILAAATTNATQSTGTFDVTAQGSAVFYGAQVELGSFASSYIATTTAAVTRDADVLTYSGGDVPNLKTLMAGFDQPVATSAPAAVVSLDNGGSQWAYWYYLGTGIDVNNLIRFQGYNGAVQWQQDVSQTQGSATKATFSMATNDIKMSLGGATVTPDVSAAVPSFDRLSVGHLGGSFQPNANIGPIYGWTRNQSQSELNAVTA